MATQADTMQTVLDKFQHTRARPKSPPRFAGWGLRIKRLNPHPLPALQKGITVALSPPTLLGSLLLWPRNLLCFLPPFHSLQGSLLPGSCHSGHKALAPGPRGEEGRVGTGRREEQWSWQEVRSASLSCPAFHLNRETCTCAPP